MVTSKVLNPEKLKKIKGNRETSSLTTSFHHTFKRALWASDSFVIQNFTEVLFLSGWVSILMGDIRNIPLRGRSIGPKIIFQRPKIRTNKIQIFLACLMQNKY